MATCAREGHAVAIVEAALIVKSGLHGELDRLVVVAAEEALRIQRVMARDGVTEAEVRARMRHQTPRNSSSPQPITCCGTTAPCGSWKWPSAIWSGGCCRRPASVHNRSGGGLLFGDGAGL